MDESSFWCVSANEARDEASAVEPSGQLVIWDRKESSISFFRTEKDRGKAHFYHLGRVLRVILLERGLRRRPDVARIVLVPLAGLERRKEEGGGV